MYVEEKWKATSIQKYLCFSKKVFSTTVKYKTLAQTMYKIDIAIKNLGILLLCKHSNIIYSNIHSRQHFERF